MESRSPSVHSCPTAFVNLDLRLDAQLHTSSWELKVAMPLVLMTNRFQCPARLKFYSLLVSVLHGETRVTAPVYLS